MKSRLVSIHQPDLLPYSGFWFKMAVADVFILACHDQFQKHGYQRRVKMRESWVSHQLVGKPALVPINTVEVQPGWQARMGKAIRGRYSSARYFKTRGAELLDRLETCTGTTLVEVNEGLIAVVRDLLGITTPLVHTPPPRAGGRDRLIEQVQMVGGSGYLSGSGGAAYMGDDATEVFADAGIELIWSDHQHTTGDSIVTVLMDFEDPMEVVMRRHDAAVG